MTKEEEKKIPCICFSSRLVLFSWKQWLAQQLPKTKALTFMINTEDTVQALLYLHSNTEGRLSTVHGKQARGQCHWLSWDNSGAHIYTQTDAPVGWCRKAQVFYLSKIDQRQQVLTHSTWSVLIQWQRPQNLLSSSTDVTQGKAGKINQGARRITEDINIW